MLRDFQTFKNLYATKTASFYACFGALTGFMIIGAFVFPAETTHPDWSPFWRLKPLILTPVITAGGGLLVYAIQLFFHLKTWNTIAGTVLSILVFVITLWIGIVLGLNGTLWD